MYLSGSKWHMKKRSTRRTNPWRVLVLLTLVGGLIYVERVIVPTVPPLFVPTPTATRSPASFALEAASLFQSGKLEQAEVAYTQAIAADPQTAAHYVELARVQIFSGKFAEAETNARNALLIDPNDPRARALLAWALDKQGDYEAARTEVERALELDPNSAMARAYHAEILMDLYLQGLGDYRVAIDEARRALDLDPGLLEAHWAMGYVMERTENYAKAFESYQTALRINPNLPLLHLAVGHMYFAQGQVEEAIESYLRASSLSPGNPEPLLWIAQAYARIGEYGKASQYAASAMRLDTANPYYHGNLGRMLYKNNEFSAAIAELELAIRGGTWEDGTRVQGIPLQPEDNRIIEYYYMYGLALAKSGRCAEAVDIFQALLQGVPGNELAVVNATEGLVLCGVIEPTPTPRPTAP